MESLPDPNADKEKKEKSAQNPEGRMTFTEHLGELRTRLVRSGIAIALGFVVCYWQSENIKDLVLQPLTDPDAMRWFEVVKDMVSEEFSSGEDSTSGEADPEDSEADPEDSEADPEDSEADPEDSEADPEANTGEEVPSSGGRLGLTAGQVDVIVLNPLETVLVYLKISAYGGILLALPVLLFEMSGFIFPGLTRKERTMVRILVIGCTALSVSGVAIAYFLIFPLVMPYLMAFAGEDTIIVLRMSETVSLLLKGFAGFGIAFQFPMAVLILVYMGLLTPAVLKQYRRVAVVGMLVASMLLTPPDPFSMILMAGPLILLYEGSIWVSYLVLFFRRKKQSEEDNPEPDAG